MTTSHLTPRILVAVMLAAISIGVTVTAQRVSESELLLREALHKQQVQGDLPEAIKIYQQIVSARNGDRSVTARALLELAGCYEKLGQQAEAVYQRIVRDFADQPVAAHARARLAALRPPAPAPTILRKLDVGEDVMDVVASDGQRAVFLVGEPGAGRVLFGDLSRREKREITRSVPTRGRVSRDLSAILAYRTQTQELSVIRIDGSGERVLDLHENGAPFTLSGSGPSSMDWSWDNRYILITNPHETGLRLLRVTVADGAVTEVPPGLRGATDARLSPDNQFIAYVRAGTIHVVPSAGGESHSIATNGELVDWTRDGRYVLIKDRRADGWLLNAVPVQQGRPQGEPLALRSLPGSRVQSTINGSLFVATGDQPEAVRNTWLGTLDDATASTTWTSLNLVGSPMPGTLTAWSPDGTRFAYVTGDVRQTMRVIRVKNIATGDDRELYRVDRLAGCVAAHHEDVLFCTRVSVTGEQLEILSVPFESGRSETRGTLRRGLVIEQVTTDDRKVVFFDIATNRRLEWEIATGQQRDIPFYRSEDGRWSLSGWDSIRIRPATDSTDWRLLIARVLRSADGLVGAQAQQIRVPNGGLNMSIVRFSPDGNWVAYHDQDAAGKDGLYRIASDGGQPQRLGDYPTPYSSVSSLSISPDGRRFLVHAPRERRRTGDYWVLENFLPAAPGIPAAVNKRGK